MLTTNSPAPEFTLQDQSGQNHSLAQYKDQTVLLYFYPKDDTPGCTVEACSFRDNLAELKAAGVQVLGVSGDDVGSHTKFADKFNLNFPILADPDHNVGVAYGVYGEKSMFGKVFDGYHRESFLIRDGVVVKHYPEVKPEEHVAEILADVKNLAT